MYLNKFFIYIVIISIFFGLSESTSGKGKEKLGTNIEAKPDNRFTAEHIATVQNFLEDARMNLEGKAEQKDEIFKNNKNQRKTTSPVWDYFNVKFEPIEEGSEETVKVAQCKKCNNYIRMPIPQNLSNLDRHLEARHKEAHESVMKAKEKKRLGIVLRKSQGIQLSNTNVNDEKDEEETESD
ncbi:hypothetical protein ACQ4LE_000948 [Meloidogyne hapla]